MVMRIVRLGLWLVALGWLLSRGLPALAQEGRELTYGAAIQDRISAESVRQVYYFQARRGDVVSIQMTTLGGNLDALLLLVDNTGHLLATSDDGAGAFDADIDSVQVEEDNFYFIIATRFGQALGVTEGTFALTLERVGVVSEAGAYLDYGDSVVGIVNRQNPSVTYIFEAERGDIVNIDMQRISGNLDSYLKVTNTDGRVVTENDDKEGGLDAGIENLLILDPGQYTIVASRFGEDAGTTEGSFVLTLDTAPISGQALTPNAALLLRYGEELSGTLDDEAPIRYYTFGAKRGDIVTISMTRTGSNLDPLVALLSPTLTVLQEDDDSGPSNNALLQSFIIPETGTYYIQATRFNRETGDTSGPYTIRLDGVSGEAPVVAPGTLTILYDSTVRGTIGDDNVAIAYAFLGNEGDVITLTLNKTSGNLDPALLLFSADSVELANDDDSGPEKNARIADFVLPQDGIYYVIATRFEYQDGDTSGGYELSLGLAP
jgi:hypothetical protein